MCFLALWFTIVYKTCWINKLTCLMMHFQQKFYFFLFVPLNGQTGLFLNGFRWFTILISGSLSSHRPKTYQSHYVLVTFLFSISTGTCIICDMLTCCDTINSWHVTYSLACFVFTDSIMGYLSTCGETAGHAQRRQKHLKQISELHTHSVTHTQLLCV